MTHKQMYYKATRPDGTDFRTGTLLYEVGKTVKHPYHEGGMLPNDPATYLSVTVEPGESLVGGSWPCRLFTVEPVGDTVTRTDGQLPHKRGCKALTVIEALPAHKALGPNGEAVAAIIERATTITYDEAQQLRAAWAAARDAAWAAAWAAARDAARDAAWDAAWAAARDAAWAAARDAAWDAVWAAAWAAAWDAVWAAVVQDLITPEQYNLLAGPWHKVLG
jgi:hypothetical protein